jgi:hypothetical protein
MSCCGQQRKQLNLTKPTQRSRENPKPGSLPKARKAPKPGAYIYFKYTGATGLTVGGPVSGKRYRFERPGAIVAVDPRDRRALATVPILRQVRNPKN